MGEFFKVHGVLISILGSFEIVGCRKTMSKWTEQVKVCSRTALEGSLDDGYSWRKYGQKEILGAKFPRYETFFFFTLI